MSMLALQPGESLELARVNARTGDYRMIALRLELENTERATLHLELYRQTMGDGRRWFDALRWHFVRNEDEELEPQPLAHCNASTFPTHAIELLNRIAEALRHQQRPSDALLLPFLSRAAQILWTQPMLRKHAA